MILRKSDFALIKASWSDKAKAVAEIARELNIGVDSLVFIDDNPKERELVRTSHPDVLVPELPSSEQMWVEFLKDLGLLPRKLTEEDSRRSELYEYQETEKKNTGKGLIPWINTTAV